MFPILNLKVEAKEGVILKDDEISFLDNLKRTVVSGERFPVQHHTILSVLHKVTLSNGGVVLRCRVSPMGASYLTEYMIKNLSFWDGKTIAIASGSGSYVVDYCRPKIDGFPLISVLIGSVSFCIYFDDDWYFAPISIDLGDAVEMKDEILYTLDYAGFAIIGLKKYKCVVLPRFIPTSKKMPFIALADGLILGVNGIDYKVKFANSVDLEKKIGEDTLYTSDGNPTSYEVKGKPGIYEYVPYSGNYKFRSDKKKAQTTSQANIAINAPLFNKVYVFLVHLQSEPVPYRGKATKSFAFFKDHNVDPIVIEDFAFRVGQFMTKEEGSSYAKYYRGEILPYMPPQKNADFSFSVHCMAMRMAGLSVDYAFEIENLLYQGAVMFSGQIIFSTVPIVRRVQIPVAPIIEPVDSNVAISYFKNKGYADLGNTSYSSMPMHMLSIKRPSNIQEFIAVRGLYYCKATTKKKAQANLLNMLYLIGQVNPKILKNQDDLVSNNFVFQRELYDSICIEGLNMSLGEEVSVHDLLLDLALMHTNQGVVNRFQLLSEKRTLISNHAPPDSWIFLMEVDSRVSVAFLQGSFRWYENMHFTLRFLYDGFNLSNGKYDIIMQDRKSLAEDYEIMVTNENSPDDVMEEVFGKKE